MFAVSVLLFLCYFCAVDVLCSCTADPSLIGCNSDNISESGIVICTAINGCNITIPCGSSSDTTPSYQYDLIFLDSTPVVSSSLDTVFIVLSVSLAHQDARVMCRNASGLLQAEYLITVYYSPVEVELYPIPDPVVHHGLTVVCPIEGNPRPFTEWFRYSDIDEHSPLLLPNEIQFHDDFHSSWSVDSWSNRFNGFYKCCATNPLGSWCYHNTLTFRLFSEDCSLSNVKETSILTVSEDRQDFAPNESFTIRCLFLNAAMNIPPSWWFQTHIGSNYTKLTGPNYNTIYSYSSDECGWISQLKVKQFTSAGVYTCFRSSVYQSVVIKTQECYRNEVGNSSIFVSSSSYGVNVTLSCSVTNSSPILPPTWCRVGEPDRKCITYLKGNSTFSHDACQWLSTLVIPGEDKVVYRCFISNESHVIVYSDIMLGSRYPTSSTMLIVPFIIGIFSMVSVVVLISWIGGWYGVYSYSNTVEPPVEGFRWDVFISYHSEIEEFVCEYIKHPLENGEYKVCWHHDDFLAGVTISDNINEAVDNSRKVVIVLSKGFVSSVHCMMELNRALARLQATGTRCLIPIVTSNDNNIPSELRSKVTYWTIIESNDSTFYQRLMKTIGEPMDRGSSRTERMR